MGVAIGRREGFGATTGREAISAQDIGFSGVATDKDSGKGSEGVASDSATNFGDEEGDTLSERSRTISGTEFERGESFGDVGGEEVID